MWLLNTATLRLCEFQGKTPPYAILSHTWDKEEVSFQEIGSSDCERRLGYRKIKRCCVQARADGLEYAWVDTCCIDKRSSSELSEAINSMFRWYSEAHVCYAYLADVGVGSPTHTPLCPSDSLSGFKSSRWWMRGWTLQELLAPLDVIFYDEYWNEIGTKLSLMPEITEFTNISSRALTDPASIRSFSVGERMSWASRRETTRVEDMAYCLLGIFDVNMPLLYGEGSKAFRRLQLQIMAESADYSLLVWARDVYSFDSFQWGDKEYPSCLAADVTDFNDAIYKGLPVTSEPRVNQGPMSATSMGLSISAQILRYSHKRTIAVLNCRKGNLWIGIPISFAEDARGPIGACWRQGRDLVLIEPNTPLEPLQTILLSLDALDLYPRSIIPTLHFTLRSTTSSIFTVVRLCYFRRQSFPLLSMDLVGYRNLARPVNELSCDLADRRGVIVVLKSTEGTTCSILFGEKNNRLWSSFVADEVSLRSWQRLEPTWLKIRTDLEDPLLFTGYINDRAKYILPDLLHHLQVIVKNAPSTSINKDTSERKFLVEAVLTLPGRQ